MEVFIWFSHFIKTIWQENHIVWLYLVTLLIIFTVLERIKPLRPTRGILASIKDEGLFFLFNNTFRFIFFALMAPLFQIIYYQPLFPSLSHFPIIVQLVILIVGYEISYYFLHNMLHRIPFLWQFHQIHHSIEDINAINGNLRYHILEVTLDYMIALGPVLKLGFSNNVVFYYVCIQLFVNTWAHCNFGLTYGKLNKWLVTTQVHQFHHDANSPNKYGVNYGNIFTFCDRLFGTFFLPDLNAYPERLGLEKKAKLGCYPYPIKGYFRQQLYPFRKFLPKSLYKPLQTLLPYKKPEVIPKHLKRKLQKDVSLAPTLSGELYRDINY